jgi:glutamate synthase (NADPH/NADH) large chain
MTGGRVWVLDLDDRFRGRVNRQSVTVHDVEACERDDDAGEIRSLLELHVQMTDSEWGRRILDQFEHFVFFFRSVRPKADTEAMKQGGAAPKIPLQVVS